MLSSLVQENYKCNTLTFIESTKIDGHKLCFSREPGFSGKN
jgi:hypothetical protein